MQGIAEQQSFRPLTWLHCKLDIPTISESC